MFNMAKQLEKSPIIQQLPVACADEAAAAEFFEAKRWPHGVACPHCGVIGGSYKMTDRKTGLRNSRFLWRCRDCSKQFTVRTGTILEESLVPLRKWARVYWESASAKNGVSALEMSRKIEVSYKTALFMMHRIRHAMSDGTEPQPKLTGTLEADETFIGGRVRLPNMMRNMKGVSAGMKAGLDKKVPVMAILQRGGTVRTRVLPKVNSENVLAMIREHADPSANLHTDSAVYYHWAGKPVKKHRIVNHSIGEYVHRHLPDVHTNTVESFFSRVKRSLNGTFHAVSKEHLHRYCDHWAFLHNTRGMTDGERTVELIRKAQGKRLTGPESRKAG
jgi:transposase-like protein